jgi:aspartyl-tRNA(Asn)/glutamyl-tRNA(Gln) amidotransferase subunit A
MRGIMFARLRKAAVKGKTFYVPKGSLMEGLDEAVARNFDAALARIARAGGKIRPIDLPAVAAAQALIAKHGNINLAEAYHVHHDRVNGPEAAQIDQRVVQRILQGKKMSAHDLLAVQETRAELIAETEAAIGDGYVVLPTTAKVAPALDVVEKDVDAFTRENLLALRNTSIGNFLDWCGLSIPSGTDAQGLPTGFMLSARHGQDSALLALGMELEPLIRG